MISVNSLSLYFGGQDIFKEVSFMINRGDKIGLVGKNGAGKSTLLKVLAREQSYNEGNISFPRDLVVGYLMQDIDFEDGRTVLEEVQTSFEYLNKIESQMNKANQELTQRTDYDTQEYLDVITEFNDLEEMFRLSGGHTIRSELSSVLKGLGFQDSDFDRQTTEFSGGWRMRIEIAKILLKKPDLLLLDEPTNHLDIESIVWLEGWLKNYTGAVILVSHDKQFLDSLTNRTIEIAFAKINNYKAAYSHYLDLRKERIKKQIQAKKNQDRFIKDTKVLIDKFRAKKNKAAFAQTLIKKLERLEIIEVEQEDVSFMQFKFFAAPHSGKLNLLIDNVSKSYGQLQVLNNISLEVLRGDKIAFVGRNGEGKTTLAKIIANEIDFVGSIELGHQVKMGYYAQDQVELLDPDKTILETIEDSVTSEKTVNVRSVLGSFLFSNDEVDKKIKILSGGERARVALCKLLLEPYNLLVLDEPTNHLDIISKALLKKALVNYDGSLILVSHDRDFLQGLTKKVYEFKHQKIKEYIGDIDHFLLERKLDDFNELDNYPTSYKQENKEKDFSYREQQKVIRRLKNKIQKIEKEIAVLEQSKKIADKKLADPSAYKLLSNTDDFFKDYQLTQKRIRELESSWEELMNKLEKNNDH